MDKVKSFLTFHNYFIDELIFKRNLSYQKEIDADVVKGNFNIEYHSTDEKNKLKVSVTTQLFDDSFSEEKNPFFLYLTVSGLFEFSQDEKVGKKLADKVLKANSIAILYPYIRSIITNITASANIPPVIMPPINTYKLIDVKESEETMESMKNSD